MIKKIAWDAFKNTGDINTFLELKQIENIESNIQKGERKKEENNEILKNENIIKKEDIL